MSCAECYWNAPDDPFKGTRVCCEQKSPFYNQVASKEEVASRTCDLQESIESIINRFSPITVTIENIMENNVEL